LLKSVRAKGLRSKPTISSGRGYSRRFKDALKHLGELPFPVGGVGTPLYMDLLAELAELDASMFTWLSKMNEYSDLEIEAELNKVKSLENRARLAIECDDEPDSWKNVLRYVSAIRTALEASGIPASGI
jgi:hypothetical protein